MKYANFCDTGKNNINIGDYLQFMIVDYIYSLMGINEEDIVRLRFDEVAEYEGEDLLLPTCYTFIDFVKQGRLVISPKITPIFFAVTLQTVDKFMDVDEFLSNEENRRYLIKHGPIGCRDEITYHYFERHKIPAYINGCMTAVIPKMNKVVGDKILLADVPQSVLPFLPKLVKDKCIFSSQQYHFDDNEIMDYRKIFNFVKEKYIFYRDNIKFAITSRLHVALPLAASGIPVVFVKNYVDGRFSFIENYLNVYDSSMFSKIDWKPEMRDFEEIKCLLLQHAIAKISNSKTEFELAEMEKKMTQFFMERKVQVVYKNAHRVTHTNTEKFDEFAERYWNREGEIKYAFWGISKNNYLFWRDYIKQKHPNAKLVAIFDSYQKGELDGMPYYHPNQIIEMAEQVTVLVCSVGAAQAAKKYFKEHSVEESQYCITADCYLTADDI